MSEPIGLLPLTLAAVPAAAGLYLNLPLHTDRRLRRLGAGLVGLSLALLLVFLFRQRTVWPDSVLGTAGTMLLFLLPALLSLGAAALTVAGSTGWRATVAFAAVLLGNTGVFLFHGAWLPAVLTTGGAAGLTIFILRELKQKSLAADERDQGADAPRSPAARGHEPLLACVMGGLLATVLLGTIDYALTAETRRNGPHRSALPSPRVVQSWLERGPESLRRAPAQTDPPGFATALWSEHTVPLALLALLLLIAATGCAALLRLPVSGGRQPPGPAP